MKYFEFWIGRFNFFVFRLKLANESTHSFTGSYRNQLNYEKKLIVLNLIYCAFIPIKDERFAKIYPSVLESFQHKKEDSFFELLFQYFDVKAENSLSCYQRLTRARQKVKSQKSIVYIFCRFRDAQSLLPSPFELIPPFSADNSNCSFNLSIIVLISFNFVRISVQLCPNFIASYLRHSKCFPFFVDNSVFVVPS